MKWFLVVAILLLATSCGSGKTDKDEPQIGKYVYIDERGVIHSKNRCFLGMTITNEDGVRRTLSIEFVDTAEITASHLLKLCPHCVTDGQYETLKRLADNHKDAEIIDWYPGMEL